MEPDVMTHNAGWLVPALIFAVSALGVLACGLVVWIVNKAIAIAMQFRKDVLGRLDQQDREQEGQRHILSAIKDLLQDEVNKLRSRLWSHDARLSRLEEHNGLHPLRRYDEGDTTD